MLLQVILEIWVGIKTDTSKKHITLRLKIFQICAFSVLIYIERNFCSDTTSVELYIILFKGNTIFSYCRDSSLSNTSFGISLFL